MYDIIDRMRIISNLSLRGFLTENGVSHFNPSIQKRGREDSSGNARELQSYSTIGRELPLTILVGTLDRGVDRENKIGSGQRAKPN